eukprot:456218_1
MDSKVSYLHDQEMNVINTEITQASVKKILSEQLLHGDSNNYSIQEEIVSVLGGINNILNDYLSESNANFSLNQTQIQNLHQLISTSRQYKQKNKVLLLHKIKKIDESKNEHQTDITEISDNWYYELNQKDTYLTMFFGQPKGDKIANILHGKMIKIILILSLIIIVPIMLLYGRVEWISAVVWILWYCTLLIPYCTFWLLSVNSYAFKLLTSQFEFWLKIVYVFNFQVFRMWSRIEFSVEKPEYQSLFIFREIIAAIAAILATIVMSSFDAININIKWKIILSTMTAVMFSYLAMSVQFKSLQLIEYSNNSDIYLTSNIKFSLRSFEASAGRILAIFFWKQAVLTFIRSKTNKCTLIKYTPYIIWNSEEENNNIKNETNTSIDEDEIQQNKIKQIAVVDDLHDPSGL